MNIQDIINAIQTGNTRISDHAKDEAKEDRFLLKEIFFTVYKKKNMKLMDEQCAVCGGQLIEKKVEKLLRGGNNMAFATVVAEVCLHCGERFYPAEIIERFEEIEWELEREETRNFKVMGHAFQVGI